MRLLESTAEIPIKPSTRKLIMKKILIPALIALLALTLNVKATEDAFATTNLTNLVATVKVQAKTAIKAKKEAKYRIALTNISTFVAKVTANSSFAEDKRGEVRETLVELKTVLKEMTEKFQKIINKEEIDLQYASTQHGTGNVFSADLAQAGDIAIANHARAVMESKFFKKQMLDLSTKMEKEIERLR